MAQPCLKDVARAVHVGPSGAGNIAKLVNNLLVGQRTLSHRRGDAASRNPLAVRRDALKCQHRNGRSAVSEVMSARDPAGTFDSGFFRRLMRKDVRLALDLAAETGSDCRSPFHVAQSGTPRPRAFLTPPISPIWPITRNKKKHADVRPHLLSAAPPRIAALLSDLLPGGVVRQFDSGRKYCLALDVLELVNPAGWPGDPPLKDAGPLRGGCGDGCSPRSATEVVGYDRRCRAVECGTLHGCRQHARR